MVLCSMLSVYDVVANLLYLFIVYHGWHTYNDKKYIYRPVPVHTSRKLLFFILLMHIKLQIGKYLYFYVHYQAAYILMSVFLFTNIHIPYHTSVQMVYLRRMLVNIIVKKNRKISLKFCFLKVKINQIQFQAHGKLYLS